MSAREWKPGDVAATDYRGVASRALVVEGRTCPREHPTSPHWHGTSGGWNHLWDTEVSFRRLVVIDPEDREQIDRLYRALVRQDDSYEDGRTPDELQTALRSLIRPPKPAEPTGLGAVVEDAEGQRFIRQHDGWWRGDEPCHRNWTAVDAVRVLSVGVTS